jgi:CRISPR-associated protein Cas2
VTVIVLIATAEGLRGHLTRWMLEVAAGVFVGNPSARVRERV